MEEACFSWDSTEADEQGKPLQAIPEPGKDSYQQNRFGSIDSFVMQYGYDFGMNSMTF